MPPDRPLMSPTPLARALFFSIDAAAEQDCADDDRRDADDRRNRMLRRLVGLDFQIAELHHVFGLMSGEFRDCKSEQPEQDQDRTDHYDWLHKLTPSNFNLEGFKLVCQQANP